MAIKIDMNHAQFQSDLFSIQKIELNALVSTLKKISKLEWDQLHKDKGLRWEAIINPIKSTKKIYSFRFSKKYRVLALRDGDFLRLLSLHVDHDSAY
jgi:hypothetical protein